MDEFFTKDFMGGPFVLFSTTHLAAICAVVLACLSLFLLRRSKNPQVLIRFRYTLAMVLILNEIAWHVWNAAVGQWTIQTMLPLHLCSVFVFGSAYMLIKRSYTVFEFGYLLGLAGAIQPIFTPDLAIYDFPHFRYFQTYISHGGIIMAILYMVWVEGYRPYWRSVRKVLLFSNVYLLFVGIVNTLIGSNYMFIAHKPPFATLLDVLGPWPWYIFALEGIAIVLMLLFYLPFALRDLFTARNPNPA